MRQEVSYTGMERDGVVMGDTGLLLSTQGQVSHVRWATGSRSGQVIPVYDYDLVKHSARGGVDPLDDSLDLGGLTAFSARSVYDQGGATALLNEMVESGHLAAFSEIAEEALTLVASRIRQDPSVRQVLAELDEDEGETFLREASASLIGDAFYSDSE